MPERRGDRRLALPAMLIVVTLTVLGACDRQRPRAAREARLRIDPSFVGRVEGTDAFVGIARPSEGAQVLAFLSDGRPAEMGRRGATSEWFVGVGGENGEIDLTSRNGVHLQARMGEESVTGTLTFQGGRMLEFAAQRAKGDKAGLYREEASVGDVAYLLGWIVLNDGKERGASFPPFIRCGAVVPLLASVCPSD